MAELAGLKGADADAPAQKQGSGHSRHRREPAGRAPGLEQAAVDVLGQGDVQDLEGTADKGFGDVAAVDVDHPGRSGQDRMPVTADQVGRWPRGGQAAQLLRADWNPMALREQGPAFRAGLAPAVVAGAQPHQAGTDQAFIGKWKGNHA